jgi:hypothetical protein
VEYPRDHRSRGALLRAKAARNYQEHREFCWIQVHRVLAQYEVHQDARSDIGPRRRALLRVVGATTSKRTCGGSPARGVRRRGATNASTGESPEQRSRTGELLD